MKDLIIRNRDEIAGTVSERDGNTFTIKPVVAGDDIDTFSAAFIEVPVGKYAFGYHFHFYLGGFHRISFPYHGTKGTVAAETGICSHIHS